MSKAKLLFDLITYVNAKRSFTAQDVADEFDISVRTAHRYLTDIGEMGVPLYTEPGRGGGYRILNNRVLPPIMLDEAEAFAVFFAFQSLRFYGSLPFDINIGSVSRKLYAGLPDDTKSKVDRLDSVLTFWNKKRSVPSRFLKEIIEAALERKLLRIEYASKTENTSREVAPIGVYAYDGFWYMPAFDRSRNETRLFRTDRILSLEAMPEHADQPYALAQWLDLHRRSEPKTPYRLYVELTREGIRQCRSQPWLEPYIVEADSERDYADTEIDKSELEYVARYFFQLGTSAKVVEPQEVVDRICSLSENLLRNYSGTSEAKGRAPSD